MTNGVQDSWAEEVESGGRFRFGENWRRFLETIDERRIADAERTLLTMLGASDLRGRTFLDIGSGSGLMSLAAVRAGARVHSFDYDADSVACTAELRRRFAPDADWKVERASVLDRAYLATLGQFDDVYSWGVLHHTGRMWEALESVGELTAPGGRLFIALYNDAGKSSRRWTHIKRAYNALPPALRWLVLWPSAVRFWGRTMVGDTLRGRPFATWRQYDAGGRGMSPWRDVVDWVGGWPYEVAAPDVVFRFFHERGFTLEQMTTVNTLGCNEFVFRRASVQGR